MTAAGKGPATNARDGERRHRLPDLCKRPTENGKAVEPEHFTAEIPEAAATGMIAG
jgi:hypothetical protein